MFEITVRTHYGELTIPAFAILGIVILSRRWDLLVEHRSKIIHLLIIVYV
jgi:hypothetical protein